MTQINTTSLRGPNLGQALGHATRDDRSRLESATRPQAGRGTPVVRPVLGSLRGSAP